MQSNSSSSTAGRAGPLRSTVRHVLLPVLLGAVATVATSAPGWAVPAAAAHPAGAGHHRPGPTHHRPRPRRLGSAAAREARALQIALAQRGKPYVWGAEGPRAFDCSGLTSFAFHHAGFAAMPRTAAAQSAFARHISRSQMRPGDLIFFSRSGYVYHVGLYAGRSHGRRLILNAPHTGARVRIEPLWTAAWFPGTLRYR